MAVPFPAVLLFPSGLDLNPRKSHPGCGALSFVRFVGGQTLSRLWHFGEVLPNAHCSKMTGCPLADRIAREGPAGMAADALASVRAACQSNRGISTASPPRVADSWAQMPAAAERGIAVFAREAFLKGRLFRFASEAGIDDRALVARCSIRWILSDPRIASTMVGVSNAEQLESNCAVADALGLTDEEQRALAAIRATPGFQAALTPRPNTAGD